MPNYKPKGVETMRALGRAGGKKSGEVRRQYARERLMLGLSGVFELWRARMGQEAPQLPDLSGGSHDTDWRCPKCRQFHSAKRWLCQNCGYWVRKRRITRAQLREREAEHRTMAILSKHGLAEATDEALSSRDGEAAVTSSPRVVNSSPTTRRPGTIDLGAIANLDLLRLDGE